MYFSQRDLRQFDPNQFNYRSELNNAKLDEQSEASYNLKTVLNLEMFQIASPAAVLVFSALISRCDCDVQTTFIQVRPLFQNCSQIIRFLK